MASMKDNKAVKMLKAAEEGGYGVVGVVSYNLETITAVVRAAEKKKSPAQILLFPWALHYSPLLIHLAAAACATAKVPIVLHMDHAQSEEEIIAASEYPFDSIMVDMSHYEKEDNLEKTERITKMLHAKGIATEAEPGRINGGEDGIADTGDLAGMLTDEVEARRFVDTGIDFLAPAFGNVHGNYGGVENIKLDYQRLDKIREAIKGKATLVLHGTNTFPDATMQGCIKGGMTRCNVNELVLSNYNKFIAENTGKIPLTELMGKGTDLIQELIEYQMDVMGSTGKA
ncbi:related to fructose-bisphosphate aldolase [Rhynchosporium agropyri]|uniref:Fructose-bisphosphate aldolase n=1 Tax=Rhynchosporium agropyri TaxID=914238 RepID=A0A1E1K5R6_9HELO|nr:related to fructose-bisphosphate aldolase [Rhynchosporium agropyri]